MTDKTIGDHAESFAACESTITPVKMSTKLMSPPIHIQQKEHPPNGGLKAWLQVLGGFCIFVNTW